MRERTEALVKLGGWSNSVPPPDYGFLVNMGLRVITRKTEYNIEDFTLTTIANQTLYPLYTAVDQRAWIGFWNDALYNVSAAATAAFLPQTTRSHLRSRDVMWRQTPASSPQMWYWADPANLGLWPAPSVA